MDCRHLGWALHGPDSAAWATEENTEGLAGALQKQSLQKSFLCISHLNNKSKLIERGDIIPFTSIAIALVISSTLGPVGES